MQSITKFTTGLAVSLLVSTGIVHAQALDWDMDADGTLTEQEFVTGFNARANFGAWDSDGDGTLAADEFGTGVFDTYDADDTDTLEAGEYETFTADDRWGDDRWSEAVGSWDVDGDGILLRNEYSVGLGENLGVFADWDGDGDGGVSQDEFARGVFRSYDEDSDGLISEPELNDIGDDMGDGGFWDV